MPARNPQTIDKNVGIVSVPDARLEKLAEIYQPKKFTPATLQFVDIAGLVKGASKGEGLGNRFLADIREVDAIIHVVRCFEDDNIVHVDGSIDPKRDIEVINLELVFSDIELIERRIDKTAKLAKGDKKYQADVDLLKRLLEHLTEGRPARSFDCTEDELAVILETPLLTAKPVIYAANLSEADFSGDLESNVHFQAVNGVCTFKGVLAVKQSADVQALAVLFHAAGYRETCLRIEIHHKDFLSLLSFYGGEIIASSSLCNAAFLICKYNGFHVVIAPFVAI